MAYGSVLTDTVQSSTAATAPVFKDGNGTQIGTLCRAWVNFNGTGTPAIRGSFNVSSITDGGTGNYTVNFTTAMPDANYAAIGTQSGVNSSSGSLIAAITSTTSVAILTYTGVTGPTDPTYVSVGIFR